jgi:hypothetical protein
LAPASRFLKETDIPIACETASVYCNGISTCFSDELISQGNPLAEMDGEMCGWIIDVSDIFVDGDDAILTCALYVGVADACDIGLGVQVGTAFIMQDSVTFSLKTGSEARMFRVDSWPGQGGDSDRSHPLNVTLKSITTMFPSTKDSEMDYRSDFGFDIFSLGRGDKNSLSIQADVCTVGRTDTSP